MAEYISREEALETIRYRVCQGDGNKELICKRGSCAYCGIMEVMSDISSIEAADVQPVKHGKWEYNDKPIFGNPYGRYCCSLCGTAMDSGEDNYCPCCGANMKGDV